MFRLFGLLLVGLVFASSISSAKASNLKELGGCGFFDGSKSNHNWNIEKKFGNRYFKFYIGKSNFYYSVGTSDYSQSKATELEHAVNDAFNEWYFSDKNFRFEINKWSKAIQVQRIGKQNVGPFIGNTNGCGRLISKIKQSYRDSDFSPSTKSAFASFNDKQICDNKLMYRRLFSENSSRKPLSDTYLSKEKSYTQEAKRRGLSCGVGKASNSQTASSISNSNLPSKLPNCPENKPSNEWTDCFGSTSKQSKIGESGQINQQHLYAGEFKDGQMHGHGRLEVSHLEASGSWSRIKYTNYNYVGHFKKGRKDGFGTLTYDDGASYIGEWKNDKYDGEGIYKWANGKREGKWKEGQLVTPQPFFITEETQTASSTTTQSSTPTSAELTASQKEAERLRQELAALKAQQEQQQQTISNDTSLPTITIANADTKGKQGIIRGRASDNVGVAEVTIDGNAVAVQSNGSFEYSTFVPATGLTVTVQATDMAGLSSKQTVSLQRNVNLDSASISFDRLNPIGKPALRNKDAIALIIGIGNYENIIDAAYADKDALMFRDYAAEKLGIPESRIKTLINEDAEIGEVLLGIRKWIRRSTKPGKTDLYVFYAGHGIATAKGEAYILPYDGRPEVDLLDRTALLQKELFAEINKAKPRNVTIFLDACYTGKARTGEILMADANYRPIAIRPIDDGMPDNFTLITASSGDEFSGPLEEAKHGLFSYFLMKGMEGDADSNQDKKITAGELHQFVKENVLRQSADKQTPELQGNADRVLVTFK